MIQFFLLLLDLVLEIFNLLLNLLFLLLKKCEHLIITLELWLF